MLIIASILEGTPVLIQDARGLVNQFKQAAHDNGRVCYIPQIIAAGMLSEFFYRQVPGNPSELILVRDLRRYPEDTNDFDQIGIILLRPQQQAILKQNRDYKKYIQQVKEYNPPKLADILARCINTDIVDLILDRGNLINCIYRVNYINPDQPDCHYDVRYGRVKQSPIWALSEARRYPFNETESFAYLPLVELEKLDLPLDKWINLPKKISQYLVVD